MRVGDVDALYDVTTSWKARGWAALNLDWGDDDGDLVEVTYRHKSGYSVSVREQPTHEGLAYFFSASRSSMDGACSDAHLSAVTDSLLDLLDERMSATTLSDAAERFKVSTDGLTLQYFEPRGAPARTPAFHARVTNLGATVVQDNVARAEEVCRQMEQMYRFIETKVSNLPKPVRLFHEHVGSLNARMIVAYHGGNVSVAVRTMRIGGADEVSYFYSDPDSIDDLGGDFEEAALEVCRRLRELQKNGRR